MTSGHQNDNSPVVAAGKASHPQSAWFEEAYATCPVASIVVDKKRRIVFSNASARRLLPVDDSGAIADLESICDGTTEDNLATLIEKAASDETSLRSWKGRLHLPDPRPLEVRFIPLPTPNAHWLCQLLPYREADTEVQVRLVSELADIHRRRGGLAESGHSLVETIHRHLETAVAAVWCSGDERVLRWSAGDPQVCQTMADELSGPLLSGDNSSVFFGGHQLEMARLPLALPQNCSIQLLIATTDKLRRAAPFWNCLATTAEASMQSARLFELHIQERLHMRAVLEHMPMAVLLFDPQGKVLELNLRARAMTGRRSWDRIGASDHPFEVCDSDGNPLPRKHWPLLRAVRTGQTCEEDEFILDFGDKKRTVSITIIPITDDDDQITSFLATGRDVTQRSEEERRKDEFLSVASHELRSPLTPLSGFLHLSRKQAESAQQVDPEVLRKAESQVERLQRLIDGLLDLSRLETGKLPIRRQRIDMCQLLRRIMEPWLNGRHGERIELDMPNGEVTLDVDPDRIDQVVTNMVDNAIKHGRPNGEIHIHLLDDENQIQIAVQDEGDGMPQYIIDRVFERYFFSHQNDCSGMGIGLYVSRQIVEDHGGTIDIDSAPDQPTTITISIPRQPA